MTAQKILTRDLLRDRFASAIDAIYHGHTPAYASLVDMVAQQNIDALFNTSATRLFPDIEDTRSYRAVVRLGRTRIKHILGPAQASSFNFASVQPAL